MLFSSACFWNKQQSPSETPETQSVELSASNIDLTKPLEISKKPEDLGPALDRAFANRPALVDVVVTPEAISSDGKTGLAWVPDLQPLAAWDDAERKWRGGS